MSTPHGSDGAQEPSREPQGDASVRPRAPGARLRAWWAGARAAVEADWDRTRRLWRVRRRLAERAVGPTLDRMEAGLGSDWRRTRRRMAVRVERARREAGPAWARTRERVRRDWAGVRRWAGPRARRLGAAVLARRPSRREAATGAFVLLLAAAVLWNRCGIAGCPDVGTLTSYQPEGASVLVDRSGADFAEIRPVQHELVSMDSLPDHVGAAFVAVEDRRFYDHGGVDWIRVVGAAVANLRSLGVAQGSSTLTMQLSRTLFSDRIRREEKTLGRKLMEVRVAGELEDRFTKDELLELYLNHIYLGGGMYGIQAASRYYFGKDASALELHESAMLAALPKAPAHYDPRRNPERARTRRNLVLSLMAEQGRADSAAVAEASQAELGATDDPVWDPDGERVAPYFVQQVRRIVEEVVGERLYSERLRIYTGLDLDAQKAAEAALAAQLRSVERGAFGRLRGEAWDEGAAPGDEGEGYLQGALVLLDPRDGTVRAWIGGRDWDQSRYDRARLARRQVGSAFKPFVYAAALETGLSPSQPILDAPYRPDGVGDPDWSPRNYSGGYEGRMSMREALMRSQNVPAVRLAAAVGSGPVQDLARRVGIEGEVPASPVAALGVTAVSPLELATAYAAFASGGTRPEPRFVLRVESPRGDTLFETAPERTRVLDPDVAWLLTDMLRDVVDRGTGVGVRRVGYRGPAAGKTGTTTDATDVWFAGYTPELVGTVWVGFDETRPLPSRSTGGGVAAPVWGRTVLAARSDDGGVGWGPAPAGVVTRSVDPETGLVMEFGCTPREGGAHRELFLERNVPVEVCPRSARRSVLDRVGGWLGSIFRSRAPAPRIPGPTDPDLGFPRLPHADGSGAGERRRDS